MRHRRIAAGRGCRRLTRLYQRADPEPPRIRGSQRPARARRERPPAPEGPERDALAGQARIALRAAADRAVSLGAYEQALAFLTQALTVTTDPADEAQLLESAGDAASVAAHPDQAVGFLRRAIARYRERGDRPGTARTTAELGQAHLVTFRTDAVLAVLESAADEFADLEGDPAFVALSGQLARAYFLHAEPARAITWADRTLPAAERFDLVELVADTLVTKGSALVDLGRSYEGIGVLRAGLELAETHDLPRTALRARTNLGNYQYSLTGPADALATSRDALADARRLGLRWRVIRLVGNAAEFARLTGDWDWALGELDALMVTELEAEGRIGLLSGLVVLHAWRGEPVAGELAEFEQLLAATTDPQMLASGHDTRGAIALAEGRLAAARTEFHAGAAVSAGGAPTAYPFAARSALWAGDVVGAREDLAALDAIGIHGPIVSARRIAIEAGIAALDGHLVDAIALYRTALRGLRDLGAVWEDALVGIDMATLLDPAEPEVRAATEAAREILVRLRTRPFIERLDHAQRHLEQRESASRSFVPTAAKP